MDFNFPLVEGVQYVHQDWLKNYLNRTWEPTLTLIGVDGIPNMSRAGNVLRPYTTFSFSLWLPPTLEVETA